MAGELIISPVPYLTGANIYFQVFNAAGQIWDTGASAFETYATASIGDYDIAATELGTASGIYQASMPAAAKGIVSALARRRVGASPAETDPVVGVMAPRAWNGSAFVDVGDLATASALATADGKIDGIKAVTDALPDAGALTSLATATALQTVDDNVDAIKAVTDNLPDSGTLSSLATASALATVDNVVDAILEDTGTTLPSSLTGIEAKVDTVDSVVDGIKAVTDQLPDSGALSSLATASALTTVDGVVDSIKAVTDQLPDGGTLSSLATASALASVSGNVTAVKAVTDNLPDSGALTSLAAKADLPTNFADLSITATTGRVTVGTNHDKTGYSLTGDYDAAKTAAKPGDEMALTTGALAAVNAAADQALSDYDPPTRAEATADKDEILGAIEEVDGVADAILDAVETDGVALTNTTMQAIADALLDRANAIDGATPRAALRYIAAVLAGKVSGAGTGTEKFFGLDGTTPRVEVTVDDDGNRSAVEYDPA